MLDQHPHDLSVVGVYVVRPLYLSLYAVACECLCQRERDDLREQELLVDGQECRRKHRRKGQIVARGAVPLVASLSASRGLLLGPYHVAVDIFRLARIVVRRRGFLYAVYHRRNRFARSGCNLLKLILRLVIYSLNLYKKYTCLKSKELEGLPRFGVMSW